MRGQPDPKQGPRIVDVAAGRQKLVRERRCRLCQRRPGELLYRRSERTGNLVMVGRVLALTRHHLVPRGRLGEAGGDDVDANLVPLCGHGSAGCHGRIENRVPGARAALRQRLHEDEVAYIIEKRGEAWLAMNYPAADEPPNPRAVPGQDRRRS